MILKVDNLENIFNKDIKVHLLEIRMLKLILIIIQITI